MSTALHFRALSAYLKRTDPQSAIKCILRQAQLLQTGGLDTRADLDQARNAWNKSIRLGANKKDCATAYLNICLIDRAFCFGALSFDKKRDILFGTVRDIPLDVILKLELATVAFAIGQMCQHIADSVPHLPYIYQRQSILPDEQQGYARDATLFYLTAMGLPDHCEDFAPARATCALAECYESGNSCPRNSVYAAHLFEKAALAGLAEGMVRIAYAFYHGLGVDVSLRGAKSWLELALQRPYDQGGLPPRAVPEVCDFSEKIEADNMSPYPSAPTNRKIPVSGIDGLNL